jgi:hypothetical protein
MFNSGLNPDIVKTGLDKVFNATFQRNVGPNYADINQDDIFRQDKAKNSAVVTQLLGGLGLWDEKAEEDNVTEGTVTSGTPRTFTVASYAKTIKPSVELFEDEDWSQVTKMVKKMAEYGYITQKNNGFGVYRGAFATTKTNDGQNLCSDTHTNVNGNTVDNLLTAALTPTALKSAIEAAADQYNEDGVRVGFEPRCLLVPNTLFDYAIEITESKLKPDFNDNNVNAFSAKYNIYVKQSNWINANHGGSDTAWFLLGDNHTITRWVRLEIQNWFKDYTEDAKLRYTYGGRFREVYGAVTYENIIGSTGLA